MLQICHPYGALHASPKSVIIRKRVQDGDAGTADDNEIGIREK